MGSRFFSDEQIERLRSFPDIGREELVRFFTLTRKDLGFIDNLRRSGGRGPEARLGLAVQLCTLPWLGYSPRTSGRRLQRRYSAWPVSCRSSPAFWSITAGGRRPDVSI